MGQRRHISYIWGAMGCIAVLIGCVAASDVLFGTGIMLPPTVLPSAGGQYVEMARSRVQAGDDREIAIGEIDAWYWSECRTPGSELVEDLFFYGPKDRNSARIVVLSSERSGDNREYVFFIGRLENYMLHLFEYCEPPPSLAFSNVTPEAAPPP